MASTDKIELRSGRTLRVHGHEIVVHTEQRESDCCVCFVFLVDPFDEPHELKIFKGQGKSIDEAESSTLDVALDYLDHPTSTPVSTIFPGRGTLNVAGRKVDIFCEELPDGRHQAFPFLYRPDGSRVIIMQFHLAEAITGKTSAEAYTACIVALEKYFESGAEEERKQTIG
jgi:hypothetical protein